MGVFAGESAQQAEIRTHDDSDTAAGDATRSNQTFRREQVHSYIPAMTSGTWMIASQVISLWVKSSSKPHVRPKANGKLQGAQDHMAYTDYAELPLARPSEVW